MSNYLYEMGNVVREGIISYIPAPVDMVRFITCGLLILAFFLLGYGRGIEHQKREQKVDQKQEKWTKKQQYQLGKMIREAKTIKMDDLEKLCEVEAK